MSSRRIPGAAQGFDHILRVLSVTRFHHNIELRPFGRHIEGNPIMGDFHNVRTGISDHLRDQCEQSWSVVADDPDIDQAIVSDQSPGQDGCEQTGIDIAAAQDKADLSTGKASGMRQ